MKKLGLHENKDQAINLISKTFSALRTCVILDVILSSGVTSNSDAAQLAETFANHNCKTKVYTHC